MIRAVNIKKSFGQAEILKGITTEFEPGKTSLIIGRSGAGKTVLLKILVGLFAPTSGEIWFGDQNFTQMTNKQSKSLRTSIGMLFQSSALFDSMTVNENIGFPLNMFSNMTLGEKQKRIDYCLERVSLSGNNEKYPSELSGGMQKRVGIARAIVLEPKYLFCDEPNSGLDPKTSLVIDELIRSITKELNITTVINTHDMNSVMEIGDDINLLVDGHLAWRGNRGEVLESKNDVLQEFIFASPFLQKLRTAALSK
jgi:phospholipid/cholesterol/gamma-HCH transport system ATP-binding protein